MGCCAPTANSFSVIHDTCWPSGSLKSVARVLRGGVRGIGKRLVTTPRTREPQNESRGSQLEISGQNTRRPTRFPVPGRWKSVPAHTCWRSQKPPFSDETGRNRGDFPSFKIEASLASPVWGFQAENFGVPTAKIHEKSWAWNSYVFWPFCRQKEGPLVL